MDQSTFDQLLEMDDDEERDFSKSIVRNYFEQAATTFEQMDDALKSKDLGQLSSLGHFLKGSSAALGLSHVKSSCEKIQHFGAKKDATGANSVEDEELCLKRIDATLNEVKKEYSEAQAYLRNYYKDPEL